jgi:hypothetical protein
MRNLDLEDTRQKLGVYRRSGTLTPADDPLTLGPGPAAAADEAL